MQATDSMCVGWFEIGGMYEDVSAVTKVRFYILPHFSRTVHIEPD